MSKVESYLYLEERRIGGHLVGHRAVHVLPKGTLHDENGTARARKAEKERLEALYAPQGVIQAPSSQLRTGLKSPAVFGEAGEAPRERHEGTARGVGRRW